ncbi:peptidoglycan-binding protein [Kiloniella sp. EL199]|uniref:peptidoglycan-binding protein n=1 Tax=Kiloniella sp. EL199 TaxID=2107581 RepID=UPI000EA0D3F9|nr:peptidoglycan-binding protein [Kiloniella sp. EL199]
MSDDKLKSEDEKPTSRKSRQQTTRKTIAKKSSVKAKLQKKSTPTSTKKPAAKKAPMPRKAAPQASISVSSAAQKDATDSPKKTGPVVKTVTAKAKRVTTRSKSASASSASKGATKITVGPASGSAKTTKDQKTEKKEVSSNSEKDTDKVKESTKSLATGTANASPRPKKGYSLAKMITVAAVLFLGVLVVFLIGNDSFFTEHTDDTPPPVTQANDEPNPNASSPYGMRVEQLKEIEGLLANLNFDPGRIDGDIDHEAVAAISLFQEISGLQVDGKPTPDLLAELKAVDEMLSN